MKYGFTAFALIGFFVFEYWLAALVTRSNFEFGVAHIYAVSSKQVSKVYRCDSRENRVQTRSRKAGSSRRERRCRCAQGSSAANDHDQSNAGVFTWQVGISPGGLTGRNRHLAGKRKIDIRASEVH